MIPTKVIYIVTDLLPMIILFSIVMISLTLIEHTKEKKSYYEDFKFLIYIIYTFILFKLVTTTDFESFSNNFIPFREIFRYKFTSVLFIRNVIGNIMLFVPFGYMMSDMITRKKLSKVLVKVFAITLITSVTIEIIQMNIGRSFDIDDITLNLIGGIVGYLLYVGIHKILDRIPNILKNDILKALVLVLLIIVTIIFVFRGM